MHSMFFSFFEKNFWKFKEPKIYKSVEINRTIYSNSESSEHFLEHNIFFCLLLEVPIRSNKIKMPIETNNWVVKTYRNKLEKKIIHPYVIYERGI